MEPLARKHITALPCTRNMGSKAGGGRRGGGLIAEVQAVVAKSHTVRGSVLMVVGEGWVRVGWGGVVCEWGDTGRARAQVGAVWDDTCRQMLTIRQVFTFLDRSFVVAAPGVRSLFDMGLQQFRTHLQARPQVPPPPPPRAGSHTSCYIPHAAPES